MSCCWVAKIHCAQRVDGGGLTEEVAEWRSRRAGGGMQSMSKQMAVVSVTILLRRFAGKRKSQWCCFDLS